MTYSPIPTGQKTAADSASVVLASNQPPISVSLPSYTLDAFNQIVIGQRVNDVQCVWAGSGTVSSLVTPVYTGSGSGVWSGGQVVFSTGTTNPSTVYAPSIGTVTYTPGAEIYAYFTAYFSSGAANTFQRIGITDKVNGLFIGKEGTTFSASLITNGTITSVGQTNFNVDKLSGASDSKFTRNGVPEAINLSFQNVFRIRLGWVGSAPIVYEVLSPDDEWVIFHINRNPNTQTLPTIQNPNLPMSVWMSSNGTNLSLGSSCWATGTSSPYTQKGVSSGGYMPVQNAKDTSRTYVTFYVDSIAGITTEALVNMNINSGSTVTQSTTYTVPVGKILRLQTISATLRATTNTAIFGRIRVRTAPTVSASSGIVMMLDIPDPGGSTTAGTGSVMTYSVPDCVEIQSGQQVGISQILNSANSNVSIMVTGFIY